MNTVTTIALSTGMVIPAIGLTQATADSVSLGAGYTHESYYSLENGQVARTDNDNWHIAFDLSNYGSAIRLNRRAGTMYVYPQSTDDWTTLDTNGMESWKTHTDTYNYWKEGAFNHLADTADASDLGWGTYNSTTHIVEGKHLFVIKTNSGDVKKLYIEKLASGTYTFKHAQLNNSAEVEGTIKKADYSGKNFVYYSIETGQVVDREPKSTDWDIVFTNAVLELGPNYFSGVTQVLHNYGTTVSEVRGVHSSKATYGTFSDTVNTIGSDWKSFNMTTRDYDLRDSLTYFVKTASGTIWKLVFTGFNGSADGKVYFEKERIKTANIDGAVSTDVRLFPNPTKGQFYVRSATYPIETIAVFSVSGQLVSRQRVAEQGEVTLQTDDLQQGVYFVHLVDTEHNESIHRLVVEK